MADRWGEALAVAARLGVPPQAFWRLSVREWRGLTGSLLPPAGLDRTSLNELAAQFPDKATEP